MATLVETIRLQLREFRATDLDELGAMVADEEQMTFYPRPKTRDEAAGWISWNRTLYAQRGFGSWLIASRASGEFLGYCGIRPLAFGDASEVELAWHTKKTAWGQGIATEAASAVRELAFRRFRLRRVVAVIHPNHGASRRVAEKIGMRPERTTVVEDDYPAIIYAIARPHAGFFRRRR